MIKQLIKDIAYDNVRLSQGLTRARLIENQIKNDIFRLWIVKELEGYDFGDPLLPPYRKVWSSITLVADLKFGRTYEFEVNLPDSFGEKTLDLMNFHRIIEPIAIVESQIENLNDLAKGFIHLPVQQTQMLAELYQDQLLQYGGVVRTARREVGKVQYQNVLEQTKQKLLDTLMQLDQEFPALTDNYNMTEENKDKVQNIITNNIYGNNNPTNIGVGNDIHQSISLNALSEADRKVLETYGVEVDEIDHLNAIISETKNDKPDFVKRSMKWLGTVSAGIASRGLYEKIPLLTEFIQKLIQ